MTTNAELQKLRETAVPRGVSNLLPIFTAKASNAELWDVEGKRYIDFAGGIAVLNTGHLHPKVQAAVKAQMDGVFSRFQEDLKRVKEFVNMKEPPSPRAITVSFLCRVCSRRLVTRWKWWRLAGLSTR